MPIRIRVSILGRERDLEPGEFGLEFGFGGLGDEGQFTPILAALGELLDANASLFGCNESIPACRNYDRFSSHKN